MLISKVLNLLRRLGAKLFGRDEHDVETGDDPMLRSPDEEEEEYDEHDDRAPDIYTPEEPNDEEWNYH